jgi:hypothetical protein
MVILSNPLFNFGQLFIETLGTGTEFGSPEFLSRFTIYRRAPYVHKTQEGKGGHSFA